jgi:hypothetical protein
LGFSDGYKKKKRAYTCFLEFDNGHKKKRKVISVSSYSTMVFKNEEELQFF